MAYGGAGGGGELSSLYSGKAAKGKRGEVAKKYKEVGELVKELRLNIDAAYRVTEPWRRMALESYGFTENEQWAEADINFIKNESPTRPILTFNDILPVIRILSGIERQNRLQTKIVPRAGGDVNGAKIMTELFRYVDDKNLGFYQRVRKSNDVNITGRGYLDVYLDHEKNLHGEICIRRRNPLSVFQDPMSEEWDGRDRKWVAQRQWLTEDEAKEQWPEFEEAIKIGDWLSGEGNSFAPELTGDRHDNNRLFLDAATKRVAVFDYWYKCKEPIVLVVNLDTGDVDPMSQRFMEVYQEMGEDRAAFRFIKRSVEIVRIATFMNWILLQDEPSPLPHDYLPLTPYIGLQFYKEPLGIVEYLKDPQRLKNKGLSQALNHLNRSANSGWLNHASEGANADVLTKFGSVPGVVVPYKSIKPDRIDPSQISSGHAALIDVGANQIKATSSVNAELQGDEDKAVVSGKAIQARQKGGLVGNEDLFDNGLLGDKIVGLQIIPMIQDTFTPERVRRVVEDLAVRDMRGPVAMLLQQNKARLPDMIDSALKNEYDYIVDRSAALASARAETTAQLVEILEKMAKHGPVPLSMLKAAIGGLDIEETVKEEAVAEIERMRMGVPPGMAGGELAKAV